MTGGRSFRAVALVAALALGAAPGLPARAASPPDPGVAGALDADFPAGSIDSRARSEAALAEASRVDVAAQTRYDRERAVCLKTFLVNHCVEGARVRMMLAKRIVLRVQVEAHDWERADDAARRAATRAEQDQQRETQAPERAEHERDAREAATNREVGAAQHHADLAKQEADGPARRARFAARQAEHAADQARLASPGEAAVRAENVHSDAEKHELAAQHAQQVAEDRKVNEARREERRKSLAADEERRLHPQPRDD
jgi:hypothetical protein